MKHVSRLLIAFSLFLIPALASAQAVKTFAVAPFAMQGPDKYSYLGQAAPSMLAKHMRWPGKVEPGDTGASAIKSPVKSDAEAKSVLAQSGADYLVFGGISVVGDHASLDVKVIGKDGQVKSKTTQAKTNDLGPSLERLGDDLAQAAFGRPKSTDAAKAAQNPAGGQSTPANPNIVVNQNDPNKQTFLNPNFRYVAGPDTPGAWRSQVLPFPNFGMAVGDVDGDGKNEVVVISAKDVQVFRYQGGQLAPVAQFKTSASVLPLRVSLYQPQGEKKNYIVIGGYRDRDPRSSVLRVDGNKIVPVVQDVRYYLSVVNLPPDFKPALVAQRGDDKNVFQGTLYRASLVDGKIELGADIPLPKKTNPFNFAFLPEAGGYKIVVTDYGDHLLVYSGNKDLMSKTTETYCGSGVGLKFDELMPSMYHPTADDIESFYFVPLRILPVDLAGTGRHEILVSRNISVAAQFFENYRSFPQGEVHSLFWDGVGLSLQWKTRRIKGSLTDYQLADFDNSGKKSLVVAVNTSPGALGFASRKTIIVAYSLDSDSMIKGDGRYGNMEEVTN